MVPRDTLILAIRFTASIAGAWDQRYDPTMRISGNQCMIVVILVGALVGAMASAGDQPSDDEPVPASPSGRVPGDPPPDDEPVPASPSGRVPGDPPSEVVPEIVQGAIEALRKQHAAQLEVGLESGGNAVEEWLSAKQLHALASAEIVVDGTFPKGSLAEERVERLREAKVRCERFINVLRRGDIDPRVGLGDIHDFEFNLADFNFTVTAISEDKSVYTVTARPNYGKNNDGWVGDYQGWPPVSLGGKANFKGRALNWNGRRIKASLYETHPAYKAAMKELGENFTALEREIKAEFKNRPR